VKRLLIALAALFVFFASETAEAKLPQTTVGNPPPALQVRPTKTGHEIGAGTHIHFGPGGAFLPRFRYRYIFSSTAAQGPLSGFWLEAMVGPAIYLPGVSGNAAFNLGYEFDPFRNLALTFSPVLNNDFFFDLGYFRYSNTIGAIGRLYMGGNWVFFFEPAAFGWHVGTYGPRRGRGVGFSFQGGAGFGYKF
jgi:hypothetical protein